jgi:Mrp family chromosome partitioning ATPase
LRRQFGGSSQPAAEPLPVEQEEVSMPLSETQHAAPPNSLDSPPFSGDFLPPAADLSESSSPLSITHFAPDKISDPEVELIVDADGAKPYPVANSFATMHGMNQPIILVSGSKGGVGKSLTTMALLDYYAVNHKYLKLIDADTNNPDVFRCYGSTTEGEVLDLDDVDGWIRLVNICDASPFKTIIVNTPAQSNAAVHKHAPILLDSLRELARPLITLWVINRQRDSLELLKDYMEHMKGGIVHVVRNGYFGEEKKFELYENSALRGTVGGQGGKKLFLPDLADRVTDELYGKRTTISEAAQQFKLGDRAELQRWRTSVAAMFAEVGV